MHRRRTTFPARATRGRSCQGPMSASDRQVAVGEGSVPSFSSVQVEGAESRREVDQGLDRDPLESLGLRGVEIRQRVVRRPA
eukprot:g13154.t1